jgi:predicted Rossmann fold flavoprotein
MGFAMDVQTFDVAIIGAGAAGLFCAAMAGRRGRRVVLLDHAAAPGAKILISGGGRCNFTNLHVSAKNFLSGNPHFAKSALAGFTPQDFIAIVRAENIAFHEKRLGQLFCDGAAAQIVEMLVRMCRASGVELKCGHRISTMARPDGFLVHSDKGDFAADSLVLATGGLSIPKLGATGFAYDVARQFGLGVTKVQAGLVPLVFGGADWMTELAGVSFEALASCGKTMFRENALFTHRGMSGPAILQVSSYWREGGEIALNMLPGVAAYEWLLGRKAARPKAGLKTVLAEVLPIRLAQFLAADAADRPVAEMGNKALQNIAARINRFSLTPSGSEGFVKAEVTVGGVETGELSSQTMESRKVPGLFVIGEAVDVTGWLGGYNFQWAWSSAFAAAGSL